MAGESEKKLKLKKSICQGVFKITRTGRTDDLSNLANNCRFGVAKGAERFGDGSMLVRHSNRATTSAEHGDLDELKFFMIYSPLHSST